MSCARSSTARANSASRTCRTMSANPDSSTLNTVPHCGHLISFTGKTSLSAPPHRFWPLSHMPLVWVSLIAYIRFLFMRYPSSPKRSKPHKEKPPCTPVPPYSLSHPPSAATPVAATEAFARLFRAWCADARSISDEGARKARDLAGTHVADVLSLWDGACGIVAARLADHPAIGNMRCGGVRHAVAVPRAVLRLRGNRRAPGHVRATRFRPAGRSRRRVRRRRGARVRLEEPAPLLLRDRGGSCATSSSNRTPKEGSSPWSRCSTTAARCASSARACSAFPARRIRPYALTIFWR